MKHRSSLNFATQYASNEQGYLLGIEFFPFFKEETTAGTFNAPGIGTQGKDVGGASAPSTDISAGTDNSIQIAVDGGTAVTATIGTLTGLNTGPLIAAALETAINTALSTAGQDGRVWAQWSTDHYEVYSQKTGTNSSIVITDATSNNVADDLELGVANGGTETAGTNSDDFAFTKNVGLNFSQNVEMSEHRTGRQASKFYKQKKMVEGDTTMYVLLGADGSNVEMSTAHKLLYKACFGKVVSDTTSLLSFDCSQPHTTYLSAQLVNNGVCQSVNGVYCRNWSLSLAGDAPAELTIGTKGRDSKMAAVAQIDGVVSSSANVVVNAGEAGRYEAGSRVCIVSADGQTITAGADGSLTVLSINNSTHTVTLSTTVDAEDDGFITGWCPSFFGGVPSDSLRIATDLEGNLSMDGGSTTIGTVKSGEVTVELNLTDLDDYYGEDGNVGFVDGSRMEITASVTLKLSVSEFQKVQQMKRHETFSLLWKVGGTTGQRMEIAMPQVIFNIPAIEFPAEGPVEVTFEGKALQASAGSLDAITVSFKNA